MTCVQQTCPSHTRKCIFGCWLVHASLHSIFACALHCSCWCSSLACLPRSVRLQGCHWLCCVSLSLLQSSSVIALLELSVLAFLRSFLQVFAVGRIISSLIHFNIFLRFLTDDLNECVIVRFFLRCVCVLPVSLVFQKLGCGVSSYK